MSSSATSSGPVDFNLAAVPAGREAIARAIVKAFAEAGFGGPQQLSALANAIAESNLDPHAVTGPPEQAIGLFQLSMTAGLGNKHAKADLEDVATNINIVVLEAQKFAEFKQASSLEDAVSIFVRKIMRPSNLAEQVNHRLKIAQHLAAQS